MTIPADPQALVQRAYELLQDGEFHNLHRELEAEMSDDLDACRARCHAAGLPYKDARSLRRHGRRLLVQDALDLLSSDRVLRRTAGEVVEFRQAPPS